ncbi:efflux RND transporter periplasmic adaptor subunit [Candidatus Palauibacter sp.]|uniref:efflux RND transporter periplasmic adaptor subunit n=1 Tax=Candidatus Palauibacter sp. TaxID=3101350 RepID=UPI003AF26A2A
MEDGTRQTLYWADDAEAPASRPGFLKRLGQGAIVIGVGVLGFALLFGIRAEPAEVEPPRVIPTVSTVPARVTQGAIKVRGGGTVRPSAEVTIAPQVGGRVIWASPALVSGGRFLEGEPLLRVDPADYENAVEAAEADVAQREVALLEAEENARLALDEWARLAARENLDPTPPNALVTRQPQLDAAKAALKSAAARLDDARLALERTWIRAPFNGIVREETVDLGQFVAAGQSVGRLYATDEVEIVVPLSDNEAALIERLWSVRAGEAETRIPVGITSEYGGVEYVWSGYVDRAESALDEQTRTVDVVVRVPEPFTTPEDEPRRPPLLIGSYATVDIEGTSFEEYAVVPAGAVRDGDVLWTVRDDTLLVMTPVEPIQEVDDEAMVLGSIADGTPVIVSMLIFVTDGMTVQPVQFLESAQTWDAAPEGAAEPEGAPESEGTADPNGTADPDGVGS